MLLNDVIDSTPVHGIARFPSPDTSVETNRPVLIQFESTFTSNGVAVVPSEWLPIAMSGKGCERHFMLGVVEIEKILDFVLRYLHASVDQLKSRRGGH